MIRTTRLDRMKCGSERGNELMYGFDGVTGVGSAVRNRTAAQQSAAQK